MRPTASQALLGFGVLGALALFSGKAFTIDDPLNLWVAQRIGFAPLDPLGGLVNWNASQLPMVQMNQNPPATAYFMAAVASLFGWSERVLHLAFLLPAGLTTACVYRLGQRFCGRPLEASLAALFTPAFLVSSGNVMCDPWLLAGWCASIVFWVEGLDRRSPEYLVAGAACVGLAFLAKFSAIALLPLLFAYAWLRERRLGAWTWALLIPLATIAGYDAWTAAVYGEGHFRATLRFSQAFGAPDEGVRLSRVLVGLAFAGGCLVPAVFFAPLLWSRTALGVAAGVVLLGAAMLSTFGVAFPGEGALARFGLPLQFALFAVAGASLVALALGDLRARRDADSALLVLWLLGVLVFASLLNWVANARALLPLAPAFGILLARRLERRSATGPARGAALLASVAVALAVAYADHRFAGDVRDSAAALAREHVAPGRTTYFLGNWGLQHYLGEAGVVAVDGERFPRAGDRLIVSSNNTDRREPPPALSRELPELAGPVRWLRTLEPGVAGFYASAIGPLPWAIAPGRDTYRVWELRGAVRFTPSW